MMSLARTPTEKSYMDTRVSSMKALSQSMYPNKFTSPIISIPDIKRMFGTPDFNTTTPYTICGVVSSVHTLRSAIFFKIRDVMEHSDTGIIQVLCRIRPDMEYAFTDTEIISAVRVGDHISATGYMHITDTKDTAILATEVTILAPTLMHASILMDSSEIKYYLAYHDICSAIRGVLGEMNYIEVATPVLSTSYGGASATPFTTTDRHGELQYMRISPELKLKTLITRGMRYVYEIGKSFRNEGIDATHNPEFTMCEIYGVYNTYLDMMDIMYRILFDAVYRCRVTFVNRGYPLSPDIDRIWGKISAAQISSLDVMLILSAKHRITFPDNMIETEETRLFLSGFVPDAGEMSAVQMMNYLIETHVESIAKTMGGLVCIKHHPKLVSPLARPVDGDTNATERFELFYDGVELCNGYSELNDPVAQLNAFLFQMTTDESHPRDIEYCRTIAHAMPPTGGLGIGVSRLAQILSGYKYVVPRD